MASEVMWRRLSEEEKKKIQEKAKGIMLDFGKTLEKLPEVGEAIVDKEIFEREEGSEIKDICDDDFRELMFRNAPEKNKDFIIAEKGEWTK